MLISARVGATLGQLEGCWRAVEGSDDVAAAGKESNLTAQSLGKHSWGKGQAIKVCLNSEAVCACAHVRGYAAKVQG
jgi:hypothetical protein